MDLKLIVEGLIPSENLAPDFSTYESMVATWRGSVPSPSLAVITAKHNQIEADSLSNAYLQKRLDAYNKRGSSTDAMIVALWEQIVEGKPAAVNQLQAIRQQVKTDFPKTDK